ncbi:Ankyrin repeat domain-containing protein SOWAHA [Labeo rohita]|uniref:Ankyrin repeat domain-containing protein SOWAHA n=1 Tax=Labeo rohita TaxID=84645 RepID=A0ABQ8LFM9_LABRO|nr:Ankyrin repeat domain-containing protein SOWAHA [Labeo rohita]
MGEISEASLLDYIWSSGGKVKNSDLSKTYKHFINHSDLQLRAKYREEFKLIIDRIAVVKSENEQEPGTGKGGKPIKQVLPNPQNELQVSNPVQDCNPTTQTPAMVAWCSGPMITADSTLSPPAEEEKPEELSASDKEDELDKDSGSKLDPLEKEWIFSAASGKLSHLTHLLKQDSSLANKKETSHPVGRRPSHRASMRPVALSVKHVCWPIHLKGATAQTIERLIGKPDFIYHNMSHGQDWKHLQETGPSLTEVSECHSLTQAGERRNRKITSLFHSKKKWGSAEELAPVPEERTVAHQLMLPAFRPRKFSR